MWNTFVNRHFKHLGVDHQQPHITRLGFVQQGKNHRIDAYRFARTCGASHQHMRHLGQVGNNRIATNVFTQAHGEHGFGLVINLRAQYLAQFDGLAFGVGQFQRHEVFTGNRFDHANGHQAQRTGQVFGQVHNLRAFHARGRFNFIARDNRSRCCSQNTHFHTEIFQSFFNHPTGHFQSFQCHAFLLGGQTVQQIDLRQFAVRQLIEQGFLTFLLHTLTQGLFLHRRFN